MNTGHPCYFCWVALVYNGCLKGAKYAGYMLDIVTELFDE